MAELRPVRASILVIEDDEGTARTLVDALEMSAYRVWHASNGQEAHGYLERVRPDLILLDLVLPDVDGLVLCSQLKSAIQVPIIVCSATVRKSDAVLSLKLGADDFVRKPFEFDDLLARVEALLRRSPPHPSPSPVAPPRLADLRVGQLLIEPGRRRATLARESLVLTPTEFRLLTALAAHAESVLTRDRLVQEVWGYADASNSRTVDVHIRRLRVKLADRRAPAPSIVSVRGRGYRLTADDAATSAA